MNWFRSETQRQARGICAIAEVIGWPLTCALLVMTITLLDLALVFRGPWIFIAGAICVLLAIRAHAMGEGEPEDEDEATEYTTFWDPAKDAQREREDAFLADQLEEARARAAAAAFLANRGTAALGKPHDPVEL